MDIALLTGANAEPALAIARRLVGLGFRVYGLANKFPADAFAHRDFVRVAVNPADPAAVRAEVAAIVAREGAPNLVVLAGHHPVEEAFESAHAEDVALALAAGIAAPVAAVREAVPGLVRRRGLVVAITRPVPGPGAALGGAVEAGLAAFCDGLFGELRDTGVRVCHFRIQENAGPADPAARYSASPQSRVNPEIVADALETVVRFRENNALTRLVIRPQALREEPRLPVTAEPRLAGLRQVELPKSSGYPPAAEKIFTPEYRRPDYAPPPEDRESDFEDEGDDAVDPELAYLIKPRHRDRFVRDTSGEEGAESPEESSPEPRPRPQPQRQQKQYHDPYARPQPKPAKHGALRIQPPNTGEGDERRPQQSQRPQQQRPFDQMPRPKDWQGPKLPQGYLQNGAPTGRPAPASGGSRGPDLHPKYRAEQEARERAAAEAAAQASEAPVPETPEPKPPVVVPVIVPVETSRDAESDRPHTGRSEAVELNFAPKPAPEAPAPEETPAPEPEAPEVAEPGDAPEAKPKRKPAAKKPAAKKPAAKKKKE